MLEKRKGDRMNRKNISVFFTCMALLMSIVITHDYKRENLKEESTKTAFASSVSTKYPLIKLMYNIESVNITHKTKVVYIDDQYVDYKKVVQKGMDGEKKIVYQESYVSGDLISKIVKEEILISPPVEEILEVGRKQKQFIASRTSFRFLEEMEMVATAYDLSYESTGKHPWHPEYGITASGAYATHGTVAVDPRVIPLGTKLYIASTDNTPDYGYATALDIGGAIKGNRIDLFMEKNNDAMKFGVRKVKVYILD